MPARLAVDFGTSNTLVAVWDAARREGASLHLPELGRVYRQGEEDVSVIPSLIHYAGEGRRWLGDQVLQRGLYGSPATFRWMKRYLLHRSPGQVRVDGRLVSHRQAGQDFLGAVLRFAADALAGDDPGEGDPVEVAFTVPVESFEHYEDWLGQVAEAAHLPRFRLIDEPSAAALGYGAAIQPGDVYLIFDFGGGTLDVSVALVEPEQASALGRRCRILGKAGTDLGGATIDAWLFEEVLSRTGHSDADEEVRRVSRQLLVACEQLKERLSYAERAALRVEDPDTGLVLAAEFTPAELEDLLDRREAFTRIDRTLRRALNASLERGYGEEEVKAVLMVGGSSQMPAVQRALRRIFGRERVWLHRPLDAIARGAAAFVAGVDFFDHIQHDYAVRYTNPQGEYEYRTLVQRGAPYPTPDPVARLTVKAAHPGQTHLGIAVFEMGAAPRHGEAERVELVFDSSGAARVARLTPEEVEARSLFWMNEKNPTFLQADPPAAKGEPRFEVEFTVDANKRLLITARDVKTGEWMFRDYPVVKLV